MANMLALVFTDLVNSTAVKNELPGSDINTRNQLYRDTILLPHRQRVTESLTRYEGRVVETPGDGFFLVFPNAVLAAQWAVAIQCSHVDDPISTPLGKLTVKIGMHIGAPLEDGKQFIGQEVDYAARVAALAVGEQILLSESAAAFVRSAQIGGVTVHAHGDRTLKGIGAVPIFELLYAERSPQPLKDAVQTNLRGLSAAMDDRSADREDTSNALRKILILSANPLNTSRLRLEKEVEEIRTTLRLANKRDRFAIESRGAVRPGDLQQHLYEFKPSIVHFSGHGDGEQGLAFEDEDGELKLVSTAALSDLFKLFARNVECVLMNACYSEVQAEAIRQHIPYVIGMNQAIGDTAARKFAEGFYRGIWDDRSIEDAFASGVNAIALEGIPEALTPVLLRQSHNSNSKSDPISIVAIDGRSHVVRSRSESRCHEEIIKPGALIRIKSPDKMGKTFLMGRVLEFANQKKGYRTTTVDLREANKQFFADINLFLQWFCANVGDRLGIEQNPEEHWKKILGPNPNCTKYVEKFFLESSDVPVVLAIDNFDVVFNYPDIEGDFCGLLRGWFEKVNTNKVWGKLRQIIVYSQEPYVTHNINQSPLNVGLPVELDELDAVQVMALANAYGLAWTSTEVNKIMEEIGGHPFLVREAIDNIAHQYVGLDELLRTAPTDEGIYRDYLNERLQRLEEDPQLVEALKQVVTSDRPVRLGSKEAFKLDSLGLIERQGNDIVARCKLYLSYFSDRLRS
jgi:class 3 adenylate cyclase